MSTCTRTPYRLLLIDDDASLRRSMCRDLCRDRRFKLIGQAGDWSSAAALLRKAPFDIALLELQLEDRLALDLIGPAAERGRIVMHSGHGDAGAVVAALAAGASGYLHKCAPAIDLAETLANAMQGQVPISPTVAGHLLHVLRSEAQPPRARRPGNCLTTRELEVLGWLARGLTYREVGERCDITFHTVGFHVKQIYEKLQVSSRSAAVFEALHNGLIQL